MSRSDTPDRSAIEPEAAAPLRVFVMLSYDTLFKPRLLYQLLVRRPEWICGVAEVLPPKRKKKRKKSSNSNQHGKFGVWGWRGAVWFGMWTVANKLRSALPFPPVLRTVSTIKRVSRAFGVPYHLVDDVNSEQFLSTLREYQPDVVVSFQHQIFRRPLLDLPTRACINCHPSRLPDYRGNQPLFWAMQDERSTFGVTVHTMQPEIDAGEILSQVEAPIREHWTLAEHYRAAYELSSDAILTAIDRLAAGGCQTIPISASARYYPRPTLDDIADFRRAGRVAV